MRIGKHTVNLWIWWSIGWTLTATVMLTRFRFRLVPLLVGLLVGALLPRLLVYCERWSLARRFTLALSSFAALFAILAIGPWHVPRVVAMAVFLGAPPLTAGLLMSGFLPRAQPVVRRTLAMVIAFSAIVVAVGLAPRMGYRRFASPRLLTRMLWPVAIAALAVIPPARWRKSDGHALLTEQVQ